MNDIQATLNKVKDLYLKHFPNGHINFMPSFWSNNTFHFSLGVIKDENDCPSSIRQNDKGYGLFVITILDNIIMIERNMHYISTIPRKQFHAMGHEKLSFRLIKTNEANALKLFDKYLTRFKTRFNELVAANEIYQQSKVKDIYLNQ